MSEAVQAEGGPDIDAEAYERELFLRFKNDFEFYAPRALKIRPKAGAIRPLRLNSAQRYLHQRLEEQRKKIGRVRALILKGRQQGVSTYVQGRFFWRVTHMRGVRAFILTHQDDATNNLFGMAERFWQNCPEMLRPKLGTSNAKELSFSGLDSGYKVGTAGNKGVGRSDTIQFFHGCLGLETPVICGETGAIRRVGDVAVGDAVRTHTGAVARVSFVSSQRKPVFRVAMKGMRDLPFVATGEHRFWTPSGWRRLDELAVGDRIGLPVQVISREVADLRFEAAWVADGYAWVPIVAIEAAGEQEVRDFEVDHPDHSYCIVQGATHNSEVAYWPNAEEHVSGALQAVADEDGTEVLLESTSAGPMGVFYDRCVAAQAGETDYQLVFIPWHMQAEYRRQPPEGFEMTGEERDYAEAYGLDASQIAWRRAKVRELGGLHKFRREYPATPEEAFRVEAPRALWKRDLLDACRVHDAPASLRRIVVAIDPSGGKGKGNAEVGMIVAGKGWDGRGYVLADTSGKYSPSEWGKKAVALYEKYKADRIVAERNFGGDMVELTVRAVNENVPYKDVVASRGKQQRAEPVVALYEQGQVSHVGMLAALEDELTSWEPGVSTFSPNRLDALVWALTDLMLDDLGGYDTSMKWVGQMGGATLLGPSGFPIA